ncbi:hypothetical protein [Nocardiopsis protaetiae]|uniref:hypothetical protein n=1 Tax=Nocardiopsis protaetiae TaxID=3382270 RepID=UPI00387B4AAD
MITHTIPLDVATALWKLRGENGPYAYDDYETVHDEQVDTRRWVSVHRLIIRRTSDGTLWALPYELGLTEAQDCDLFVDDPVTVALVRAEQVTTTRYVTATQEPAAQVGRITDQVVMAYIAEHAESGIEDEFNEDGEWTTEEHRELKKRAFKWIGQHRGGGAL